MGGGLTEVNLKEILKNLKGFFKHFFLSVLYTCGRRQQGGSVMDIIKKRTQKKSRILMLMIVMSIMLFSCAGKGENTGTVDINSNAPGEDYVYVPQFHTIENDELGGFGIIEAQFCGDRMYYRCNTDVIVGWWYKSIFEYRDMNDLSAVHSGTFLFEQEGYSANISSFTIDSEGNVYIIWNAYHGDAEGDEYNSVAEEIWLVKYNSDGEAEKSINLSDNLSKDVNYVSDILVDNAGNMYVVADKSLYVYNKKLSFEKKIVTGNLYNMFLLNGETFCGVRSNVKDELVSVDIKKGMTEVIFDEIPIHYSFFADGGNGKILWADATKLYELDLETGESAEVLDWLDMNLNSGCIRNFEVLSDGRFALVYADYSKDVTEMVTLKKTPRAEVKEKEVLTLATFTADSWELLDAVAAFNRESEDYRVEIKNYYTYEYDFSQEVYDDAVTLLHMDIISGDAPDLIYLPDVDMYNLADSQALEDLAPFLETSDVLKREDFVEGILKAYEIDGRLVTIPVSFWIQSLFAKERLVGSESGWTLSEMIELREAYPDAIFMQTLDRNNALRMCLEYGWETFVDEETGVCHFDSAEFVKVLEFARSFGAWGGFVQEPYEALQKDDLILLNEVITNVEHYQMVRLMIEEPSTVIGFPACEGIPVTVVSGRGTYAIASRSDNKEGAWRFIESVLDEDDLGNFYEFPTRTDLLEEMFAEAMTPRYELDEAGNIMYDENGNPIEAVKHTWGNGSWTAEIMAATEEEIAVLRQMLTNVRLEGVRSQPVLDIVLEEAAAYFADQKSAEEVAKIIQSRVSLYVSENH